MLKKCQVFLHSMIENVRVRFAPSPTGGLHIGGVRTALFAYLFAKQNEGTFILRVEDTDQTRFVEGAEEYIVDTLEWCGIIPDESPQKGGEFGPYRQSERKADYRKYAEQLVESGHAYYAFDTPQELTTMREDFKSKENPSPQYDKNTRGEMKNSLTLSTNEVAELLAKNTPHVIRIKVPADEKIQFTDIIRGEIENDSNLLDDKVLLKADGMPTYHLAVVVDDYLMKVSHVFRGEEWLSSAPIHVLLWRYLGWSSDSPDWAHLPLILKPDGNGKLSKRDGDRLGFPVFPLQWNDNKGYREKGFLPAAFINMLSVLGWNDGTDEEMFSMNDLLQKFDVTRINKAGAKFNFDKAIWYNAEWIKRMSLEELLPLVKSELSRVGLEPEDDKIKVVLALVQERISLLPDSVKEMDYFFRKPSAVDMDTIQKKWSEQHTAFYTELKTIWADTEWTKENLETTFKELIAKHEMKMGAVMLPFRIMLVGGKFGPGVFDIAHFLGREEVLTRIITE